MTKYLPSVDELREAAEKDSQTTWASSELHDTVSGNGESPHITDDSSLTAENGAEVDDATTTSDDDTESDHRELAGNGGSSPGESDDPVPPEECDSAEDDDANVSLEPESDHEGLSANGEASTEEADESGLHADGEPASNGFEAGHDEDSGGTELPTLKFGRKIFVDPNVMMDDGVFVEEEYQAELRDQMRRIKWPVIDNAFGAQSETIENGNLVMVASAMSGEGKTFTSINLALSIAAERDIDVILVDADIAKPHASELFGIHDYTGLTEYLSGEGDDIEKYIVETDVPRLSLLAAGRPDEHASELLASARMAELVTLLGTRYPKTIVLFDSSPILQTNESHILSRIVGQVLLVVAANKTPQSAAREAVALIGDDVIINVIFNATKSLFGQKHFYGGYYGYQYGRRRY